MQPAAGTQGCCVSKSDGEYAPGSAMHGSRSRQESSSHEMARELECGPFIHPGVTPRAISSVSRAGIDVMADFVGHRLACVAASRAGQGNPGIGRSRWKPCTFFGAATPRGLHPRHLVKDLGVRWQSRLREPPRAGLRKPRRPTLSLPSCHAQGFAHLAWAFFIPPQPAPLSL